MTKQERIVNLLQEMGYKPTVDDDGDVHFMCQMRHLFVLVHESGGMYYSVLIPNIYDLEEGEEQLALAACNKMTREIKCMKTFMDIHFKNVSSAFEFYATEESLRAVMEQALKTIVYAPRLFLDQMNEIKSLRD